MHSKIEFEGTLPPSLQQLIAILNDEAIDYKDRESNARQLTGYLAGGDHGMAEFMAKQMIGRQQQFRQWQQHGLPAGLQLLIDKVNAEAINYKDRESNARQLAGYLAGGDHGMAEFMAKQMIERQQQFRQSQQHGLPPGLQRLIDQVNAEAIDYKDRASNARQLAGYLAGGDHGMAEFMAKQMIERQQQFRQSQQHGLPPGLQRLIDQVNAETIDYKDRESNARQLAGYLAGGDHGMAEFMAKQMIERQRNMHNRMSANPHEAITSQLWSERASYSNLKDDEFASEGDLLDDVKKELRAIGSFKDIEGARAYYKALNDGE